MSETALIVMARYPQAGKTKTRLARTIGDAPVVELYRAFLTDLAHRFAGPEYRLHWAHTPAEIDYQAFVETLAPEQAQYMCCFAQEGADFGARLHHAFQSVYKQGFQRIILISSDSPHISKSMIAQANNALDEADVVLGPVDDGGYYLIAMREPHDVFSGIPMSTEVVCQMTIEAAQKQGLTVRLIESSFDVDEWPDLQRLARLLAQDSSQAPSTATYLSTMRSLFV
ncbi:MAG TPA: TIGR04282 family arsenosugar biosynthesis glycosyltransferase [Ktedonobacteraceae bacterium]